MHTEGDEGKSDQGLISVINKLILVIVILAIGLVSIPFVFDYSNQPDKPKEKAPEIKATKNASKNETIAYWLAPEISTITDTRQKEQLEYGKDLIAHTAKYFGPNGSVLQITNGLNCQNCHLQ